MRSPAGTGLCCPMISLTLEMALAVSETGGAFFTSGMVVFTLGTVVVAIGISLTLKYLNYSRGWQAGGRSNQHAGHRTLPGPKRLDASGWATIPTARLAKGSIMFALGPSPMFWMLG